MSASIGEDTGDSKIKNKLLTKNSTLASHTKTIDQAEYIIKDQNKRESLEESNISNGKADVETSNSKRDSSDSKKGVFDKLKNLFKF